MNNLTNKVMKNKVFQIVLVVFAIVLYTLAVVNFIGGDIIDGISNVIMACSDVILVCALMRLENHHEALIVLTKELVKFFERLADGIPVEVEVQVDDEDEGDGEDAADVKKDEV